ncbi:hypothetical protein ACTXT7_014776 [Hymenolepis weldensis]
MPNVIGGTAIMQLSDYPQSGITCQFHKSINFKMSRSLSHCYRFRFRIEQFPCLKCKNALPVT